MIFAVPVCLLLLIVVVFDFICLYIVYPVEILIEFVKTFLFLYNCFTSFHLFDSLARTSC